MAEGGRMSFTASSYKGSDEVFDFTCTPCIQEGRHVEAVNFCADCTEFFCPGCTRQHNKFGMTSGHNIVSTDQADQATGLLPTERCRKHKGERISTYCAEHDVVVCSTCLALDHKACKGGIYIPKIAAGSPGQKKDRQRVKDEISQALKAMSQVKLSIQDRQATADKDKKEYLKQIDTYTDNIIKHARDLKEAAIADVDDQHMETTNGLRSEMKSIDDVTVKMKMRLKNLNNTHVTNDSQTFVDIKQGKKEVNDAKQLEERSKSSGSGQGKVTFVVDDSVDTFLNVTYLGKVIRTKPYKAVLKGQYSVKSEEDEYTPCCIGNTCMLLDGTLLMTDFNNSCIKLLGKSNKVVKSFNLPSRPCGVCQTSKDEVAVTLTLDRKVQFVNITGEWRRAQSFKVEDGCRGITYSNDQLLVSCGGYPGDEEFGPEGPGFIGIYDMSGTIIRKIQLDPHRRQIFSVPYHITTTSDGRKIHVADKKGGVITVDRKGNVLSKFTESHEYTRGICAVSDDILLVCGCDSNNILQIDTNGNLVAELLNREDGIEMPFSVSYARNSSRMIVTFWGSNEIKSYDLVL